MSFIDKNKLYDSYIANKRLFIKKGDELTSLINNNCYSERNKKNIKNIVSSLGNYKNCSNILLSRRKISSLSRAARGINYNNIKNSVRVLNHISREKNSPKKILFDKNEFLSYDGSKCMMNNERIDDNSMLINSISDKNNYLNNSRPIISNEPFIKKLNKDVFNDYFRENEDSIKKQSNLNVLRRKSILNRIKTKYHTYSLSKSSSKKKSYDFFVPKVPSSVVFHNSIMDLNKTSCSRYYIKDLNDSLNRKSLEAKELLDSYNDKTVKTGIFGSPDNIVSLIRARMERLKYDCQYKKVEPDIKEMIKDEIMDAQVKLGRKPQKLNLNKQKEIVPLYIKKLEKYQYLSRMNKILEINELGSIPIVLKDGQLMLKLKDDSFNSLKSSRYHVDLNKFLKIK